MAELSGIEWTDSTFNPWLGCLKVSPGCANCYAETLMNRYKRDVFGPGPKRQKTGSGTWNQPRKWERDGFSACHSCGQRQPWPRPDADGRRACESCHELGSLYPVRRRVFCASLADVFEDNERQPELSEWRKALWFLIEETPDLDWLILTKRPENIESMLPIVWDEDGGNPFIPENVYLGTSAENQEEFDRRWEILEHVGRSYQAPGLWLSAEPLIGPINLSGWYGAGSDGNIKGPWSLAPQWVIAGGESGAAARPCFPQWVRDLHDQCEEAGAAFFFKQWGRWLPRVMGEIYENRRRIKLWPDENGKQSGFIPVGRKRAGAELDGQRYLEFPEFLKGKPLQVNP